MLKREKMRRITMILIVLVCLFSTNVLMAITPEKKGIENKKTQLINKIRRTVSTVYFLDCMKCGEHQQVVLRCIVNDNEKLVVKSIVGVNEKLKQAILKRIDKKAIKIYPELCGQKMALLFKFEKHLK